MTPHILAATAEQAALLEGVSIDRTLGVLFLGNIFVAILFAVTSVQIYFYFQRNTEDGRSMKSVVLLLWSLDALHFAFVTHTVYNYAVTNFLNPLPMLYVSWSLTASVVVGGVSDFMVTSMLAYRIWKFGGHNAIVRLTVAVIGLGSLAIMTGDFAITILSLQGPGTYSAFSEKYEWVWYTTFGARAGIDVVIAVSIYLMMRKYRGGFKRTNSIVRLIIVYSVNTCALTTMFTCLSVILYAALPNSFIGFTTAMLLPKLMFNSLLAILNSRKSMRQMYESSHDTLRMRPISGSRAHNAQHPPGDRKVVIEVSTHTTTEPTFEFDATASGKLAEGRAL